MEQLSIIGKIESETPEVVVFAVQTSAFDDENENGEAIEEAIRGAVKAFEEKGATATAFAQRAIFSGEGRLIVKIAREPLDSGE